MNFPSYVPRDIREFLSTELSARQCDLEQARTRTDPEGRAVASELRKRIKVVTALATDDRMRQVYEFPLPQTEGNPSVILEVVWAAVGGGDPIWRRPAVNNPRTSRRPSDRRRKW